MIDVAQFISYDFTCVNFFSNKPELLEILGEARQRREEERKRQEILKKKESENILL